MARRARNSRPLIDLSLRGRAKRAIAASLHKRLVQLLGRAMAIAGVGDAELSLTLTDDREMRALNRTFAQEDHPTDVLSFSQREDRFANQLLGDIVISLDTAKRQAKSAQRPLLDELLHLAVHGLAHLQGLDHRTKREEKKMFAYEAKLRAQVLAKKI